MKKNELTNKEFWDSAWEKSNKRGEKGEKDRNIKCYKEIVTDVLSLKENSKLLELGCGGTGEVLKYIYKLKKIKIFGIDISQKGLKILEEELNKENIPHHLILGNIFDKKFVKKYSNKFEVVFSNGLVEHFRGDKLKELIKIHFELTKPGGYVIISVPNFNSIIYKFFATFLSPRTFWLHHNLKVCKKDELQNIVKKYGQIIKAGYCGDYFDPSLICGIGPIKNLLSKLLNNSIILKHKHLVSPHIIVIAKKLDKIQ